MPPGQDDNPFGAPRGVWGRQPPTTFGLSTPIKRPSRPTRPTNQIRVPAPSVAPRTILTGGLAPQPGPSPVTAPSPSAIQPEPVAAPPDPTRVSDSVLARASAAPKARVGGLPFPPVAGIGVVIAAIVVVGLLLLRHDPPRPAPVRTLEAPATRPPPPPAIISKPVAEAGPAAPVARKASAPARTQPRSPAPVVETPTPITPPPLAAPPIVAAPTPAPAIPPPTDPEVPMTTRLPGPQ